MPSPFHGYLGHDRQQAWQPVGTPMEMAHSGQINLNSRMVEGYGQVNYVITNHYFKIESYIHLIEKILICTFSQMLFLYHIHGGILSSRILQYPSNCTLIHAEFYRSSQLKIISNSLNSLGAPLGAIISVFNELFQFHYDFMARLTCFNLYFAHCFVSANNAVRHDFQGPEVQGLY